MAQEELWCSWRSSWFKCTAKPRWRSSWEKPAESRVKPTKTDLPPRKS